MAGIRNVGGIRKTCALGLAVVLSAIIPRLPLAQEPLRFVTFGSAGPSGSYYAAVNAICDTINRSHEGKIRCSPEPTKGSIYNLRSLMRGDQDFALVQSDWQKLATEGRGVFSQTGPYTELRSVMSLFPESLTLIARRDAGIRNVEDLAGKRIDVGATSTPRRASAVKLLAAAGLDVEDFAEWREMSGSSVMSELCEGHIDATIMVFGHPNPSIGKFLAACNLDIVPLTDAIIDRFLEQNPDYSRAYIPISDYPQLSFDIDTVALSATLVTRSDIPTALVWTFTTEILTNLDQLRQLAPMIRPTDLEWMRTEGMFAPMHPGAVTGFEAVEAN